MTVKKGFMGEYFSPIYGIRFELLWNTILLKSYRELAKVHVAITIVKPNFYRPGGSLMIFGTKWIWKKGWM